jgi:hypothetical protein
MRLSNVLRTIAACISVCSAVTAQTGFQASRPAQMGPRSTSLPVLAPQFYAYDEGTTETSIGLPDCNPQGPAVLMWIHSYDACNGSDTISSIWTAFGSATAPGSCPPNGSFAGVALWEDPNDDGDPNDALFLTASFTTVQQGDTDNLVQVSITPTAVSGKFFVGAWSEQMCGVGVTDYPGPLDLSVASQGRAWVCASLPGSNFSPVTLTALDYPPVELGSIGFPGVWLLRAIGKGGQPLLEESDLDTIGTDFIVGMISHDKQNETLASRQFRLVFNSESSTVVHVDYPYNSPSFSANVPIAAGGSASLVLPISAQQWPVDAVANNAVHASGPDPFVLTLLSRSHAASDSAIAIPTDALGREYIVMDWAPTKDLEAGFESEFVVYAAEDSTVVAITPSNALQGGHASGVTFNVTLNRGQGYKARGGLTSLTGTTVVANKPIGLVNGCRATQVPTVCLAAEKLVEVAVPVERWGQSVLVSTLPYRTYCKYRVLASQNATQCRLDGNNFGSPLNRGQFTELSLSGNHSISANAPILVTQFMPGALCDQTDVGDPSMITMIPWLQYVPTQLFSSPKHTEFTPGGWLEAVQNLVLGYIHYVTIIAWDADVGALTLDNAVVPTASFVPIGASGLSVAKVMVTHNAHETSSSRPHGITVESYGWRGAFANPGLSRYVEPAPACEECTAPLLAITISAGSGGVLQLDQPSATVGRNWHVQWEATNALAHSFDGGGRVATTGILSFFHSNPTVGAWNRSTEIPPLGAGPVALCVGILDSALVGNHPYTLMLLDQWGEMFGEISGSLIVQ